LVVKSHLRVYERLLHLQGRGQNDTPSWDIN
jgi:hypothetical protein